MIPAFVLEMGGAARPSDARYEITVEDLVEGIILKRFYTNEYHWGEAPQPDPQVSDDGVHDDVVSGIRKLSEEAGLAAKDVGVGNNDIVDRLFGIIAKLIYLNELMIHANTSHEPVGTSGVGDVGTGDERDDGAE